MLQWKAFLLRPAPGEPPRDLERFRAYTLSWQRPASEEPAALFRPGWSSEEGPPSHSVPPHAWSKAARERGEARGGREARGTSAAWQAFHQTLFDAYFRQHRDITHGEVLAQLWHEAQLGELPREPERFSQDIAAEHREAVEYGASGAPAVRAADSGYGVLMGAQPVAVYRRWVERLANASGAALG